jgi:predicted O-methyltransferase YrrM
MVMVSYARPIGCRRKGNRRSAYPAIIRGFEMSDKHPGAEESSAGRSAGDSFPAPPHFHDGSLRLPAHLPRLEEVTAAQGFAMASDHATGALLRTLAAAKPGGRLLELGTGTGVATAWLLDGMDAASRLTTIDNDGAIQATARSLFAGDSRVTFVVEDGIAWLETQAASAAPPQFDLIFADSWPGKYTRRAEALALLAPGGFYVVDDLLPQPNWPPNHQARVDTLLSAFSGAAGYAHFFTHWSTGLMVAVRLPGQREVPA